MKNVSYFSLLLLFIFACENDINTIDAGFIDNNKFTTSEISSEVYFNTENISRLKSTPVGQFLLGNYTDPEFGMLKASFVSQISLPSNVKYYTGKTLVSNDTTLTATLDKVVLYIPYQSTLTAVDATTGDKTYRLDSVFGYDKTAKFYKSFDFKIHKLNTFLSSLDPSDPSKVNTFYTDKVYDLAADGLLADVVGFRPSELDTMTIIERKLGTTTYDRDTIKLDNSAPRMAITLSSAIFKRDILDKMPANGDVTPTEFSNLANFTRYFKGLYLQTTSDAPGSIASLKLTDAFVEMYYTNLLTKTATGAHLDTIKETRKFTLGGVKASKYEHNHVRIDNSASKLFVQGASGSQGNVKLLGYSEANPTTISSELATLKANSNKNGKPSWLINEASLSFYVDELYMEDATDTVFQLFLYKKVPSINGAAAYNSQLLDYMTSQNATDTQGRLLKDSDGAYYYKFQVTDYITNLLDARNTNNVDNLGLKVYTPLDRPASTIDTIIDASSWNPRGVVLHGGEQNTSDVKRIVLKINYSTQE